MEAFLVAVKRVRTLPGKDPTQLTRPASTSSVVERASSYMSGGWAVRGQRRELGRRRLCGRRRLVQRRWTTCRDEPLGDDRRDLLVRTPEVVHDELLDLAPQALDVHDALAPRDDPAPVRAVTLHGDRPVDDARSLMLFVVWKCWVNGAVRCAPSRRLRSMNSTRLFPRIARLSAHRNGDVRDRLRHRASLAVDHLVADVLVQSAVLLAVERLVSSAVLDAQVLVRVHRNLHDDVEDHHGDLRAAPRSDTPSLGAVPAPSLCHRIRINPPLTRNPTGILSQTRVRVFTFDISQCIAC